MSWWLSGIDSTGVATFGRRNKSSVDFCSASCQFFHFC